MNDDTVPVVAPRRLGPDIGMLSHYSELPHVEGMAVMTTLDMSDPVNGLRAQQILASESESLWDMPSDRVILVSELIAHYAESVDPETGEETRKAMLTMVGPGGIFHTSSKYAFRDLQHIAMLYRMPPWYPPIAIRAERRKSNSKRSYQSIILVE